MEKKVRRWTKRANECQSLEDVCKWQGIIKKAIPHVIADCNELLGAFPMSLDTYNKEVYPDIMAGTIVAKCLSFMHEVSNISQRREFEQDTAEKKAERAGRMQAVQDLQKQETGLVVLMTVGATDVKMYGIDGIYARYIEVCDTPEYKLLRKIEESNVDNKNITLYYQAVCLYVALANERQDIEEESEEERQWRGGIPKEGGGGGIPREEKTQRKNKKDKIYTFKAKYYFDKAIKKGWMIPNDGDTYSWEYSIEDVSLCYFFIKIYRTPPYKDLEALFVGRRNLRQTALAMKKTFYWRALTKPNTLSAKEKEAIREKPPYPDWLPELNRFFRENKPEHPTE